MTTYNVQRSKHATLGAATEDIVNLSGASRTVTVCNWGATTDIISFTVGPTVGSQSAAGPVAAVSLADETYQIRGGGLATSRLDLIVPNIGKLTVRLISAQTPAYSVQSIPVIDA